MGVLLLLFERSILHVVAQLITCLFDPSSDSMLMFAEGACGFIGSLSLTDELAIQLSKIYAANIDTALY